VSKKEIVKEMLNVFGQEMLNFPLDYLDKPLLSRQDISNTSYPDAMFDRIVCISVLEHLGEEELLKTLLEFKRILKKEGLIVATVDYPYLDLQTFNLMLEESGLSYANQVTFELPGNALTTNLFPEFPGGLYSFRALIRRSNL
jgi:ubiquinone/menaquinone biosynthesis C-methylase UbiE